MTHIADLLAGAAADSRPTVSFEFFPPKSEEAAAALDRTLTELSALAPDFISVTYGALGSTRDTTRDLVIRANARFDFPAMAHLTCVGHTTNQIDELLAAYRAGGVDNILALGGDPPADGSNPGGDFEHASDLVAAVRAAGHFGVGVAAHPELHPRSNGDCQADRKNLAAKLEVADFAITQFFFDVDHFLRMRDELASLGADKPVIPGIMPFISVPGVRRMAAMNGTAIPARLDDELESVDGDSDATKALGVEVAVEQAERLVREGVAGIHLYALNKAESVRAIVAALGLRPTPASHRPRR
jgi:methylenetetrahydrofolate reductase (NADPH)